MPSLLDPDQTSPDALVGRGLLGLPVAPPDDGSVSHADALAALYRDVVASQPKAAAPSLLEQQVMRNPVGTETTSPYASQSVGVPSGPFNPIEAMTPNGPMLGTDVDRAHEIVRQGIQEYAPTLLGMVGDAPGGKGFTAYHGSPHDFPPTPRNPLGEFDPTKIGTGEGAQAYGVGAAYLAGNEGVARGYRDAMASENATISGRPVRDIAAEKYRMGMNETPSDLHHVADYVSSYQNNARYMMEQRQPELVPLYDKMVADGTLKQGGHMYEVNVNADPAHFLDWDKPLSEQHPVVQQALDDLGLRQPEPAYNIRPVEGGHVVDYTPDGSSWSAGNRVFKTADEAKRQADITMQMFNRPTGGQLVKQNPGVEFKLQEAGIPGIRYLDAGSRGAGSGTYNHVVFDANTLEIIRKYGIAGLLGGTGAVAGTREQ